MRNKWFGRFRLAVAIVLIPMLLTLTACKNGKKSTDPILGDGQSDLEYVLSKKTLVVGVTDYKPMDYTDGDKWIGFDAELAQKFADSLGVTIEFKEINWDNKIELLNNGSIDCIWNGMTCTDELMGSISCSESYLSNAQVVVMNKSDTGDKVNIKDCQHMLFAVEKGSTAEKLVKGLNYRYTKYSTQHDAIMSVCEKKADAAVVDLIMASSYIDGDTQYDNLGYNIYLNDEKICVGFRKGSDLTDKVNTFLKEKYDNGEILALAQKYSLKGAALRNERH